MKDVVHRGLCGDLDIDRDISTASCRTSPGDSVDLLSDAQDHSILFAYDCICASRAQ